MKRVIASLLLVAAMAGTAFADVFVFETVDEFDRTSDRLSFRGILQGGAEPSDVEVWVQGYPESMTTSCERMALMAMARPGRYLLRITTNFNGLDHLLVVCRLIRR
jgi:hypothetical protein